MINRTVELVLSPREPHWVGDGFRVHNFIPSGYRLTMERMSPFLVMDYGSKYYFEPSATPRGVGVHPHKGFETVTIAYKGRVEHHDSSGGGGIIGEGDVQWMTAAGGILHKEFHEKEWSKQGGEFQMVQLWVNLPAKDKLSPAKYQPITNSQFGKYSFPNGGGAMDIIAGEYGGVKGPAYTFTPVNLMNMRLNKGASVNLSFPAMFNTALLVIEGGIVVNSDDPAPLNHFVLMNNDGEDFTVTASEDALVLVLSGEPINEPIAAHGPFVMNTRQELVEAFEEFQAGKFGYLE